MNKLIESIKFDNGDEITVTVNVYHSPPANRYYSELQVWDDYEGRCASAALYDLEAIDKVIAVLQKARQEMI